MNTLVYGAGPIGRWLALRLQRAGQDVTLLARNETFDLLDKNGIEIVDGLTGEKHVEKVKLIRHLEETDRFELAIVATNKSGRLAVCPTLAQNKHLKHILFLGNDVSGFERYSRYLPAEKLLLGFPGPGGGWVGDDLVFMDREKPTGPNGEIFLGEFDGPNRDRTSNIKKLFEAANIKVNLERDMDGWLKYHFAFIAPTAGVVFQKAGDLEAVANDSRAIHQYCSACREAGDVLEALGYRKRQPPIFNLYYWLPQWLEAKVFARFFGSKSAAVRLGLHAKVVGPELLEMAAEFDSLRDGVNIDTPKFDELLSYVPRRDAAGVREETTT